MADLIRPKALSEPEVVHCVFIEGVELEIRDEFIRIIGWIELETVDAKVDPERRIVVRAALPTATARALVTRLRVAVARGGN